LLLPLPELLFLIINLPLSVLDLTFCCPLLDDYLDRPLSLKIFKV
jgi:hypothetical protein